MPWRVTEVVNERMRFVVRRESGERMVDLCREFGISRKTGYKFWKRYKELGPEGLGDFSRRPHRHPSRIPAQIQQLVVKPVGHRVAFYNSAQGAGSLRPLAGRHNKSLVQRLRHLHQVVGRDH